MDTLDISTEPGKDARVDNMETDINEPVYVKNSVIRLNCC